MIFIKISNLLKNDIFLLILCIIIGILVGLLVIKNLILCLFVLAGLFFLISISKITVQSENIFLYCFFATLPFIGIGIPIGREFGIQLSYLFAMVLIVMMGLLIVFTHKKNSLIPNNDVNIVLLIFYFVCVASIFMSAYLPFEEFRGELPWLKSIKRLIGLTAMILIYFAIITFVNTEERFYKCINIYIVSAIFVSILGIYQFLSIYFNLNLPFERLPIINPSLGGGLSAVGFWEGFPRVSSTLIEPAYFGNYLVTVIPILLAGLIYKQSYFTKSKVSYIFLVFIFFIALIITFSRAPYIGIVIGALILLVVPLRYNFLLAFSKFIKFMFAAGAGLLFLSFVIGKNIFSIILRRYFSIQIFYDLSTHERATMIITQLNIFKEFPILGVGLGNFGFYYSNFKPSWGYAVAESGRSFLPTQNIYGEIIAETGILGILSFCLILLLVVIIGLKTFKYSKSSFYKATSLGLVSGFVGYMATMFAVGDFYNFPFMWVLMGLIVAQNRIQKSINKTCNKKCVEY
jgi:hypothetical protein